jgi:hypothetical protein
MHLILTYWWNANRSTPLESVIFREFGHCLRILLLSESADTLEGP